MAQQNRNRFHVKTSLECKKEHGYKIRPCLVQSNFKFIYTKNNWKKKKNPVLLPPLPSRYPSPLLWMLLVSSLVYHLEITSFLHSFSLSWNCVWRNAHKELFFGSAFQLVLSLTYLFPKSVLIYYLHWIFAWVFALILITLRDAYLYK